MIKIIKDYHDLESGDIIKDNDGTRWSLVLKIENEHILTFCIFDTIFVKSTNRVKIYDHDYPFSKKDKCILRIL